MILDRGYVKLVNLMGSDRLIAEAASLCYGRAVVDHEKLIHSLMVRDHWSPFEFGCIHVEIKAPIFVARQIMRHRAFSYMERSGRFSELEGECYVLPEYEDIISNSIQAYRDLLKTLPMEKARAVLPLCTYTTFWMAGNIRSWCHFLRQRLAPDAQAETRAYALAFYQDILQVRFPITAAALAKKYKLSL